MKRLLLLAAAVVAAAGAGCTNARYVQKTSDEGVIAVSDRTDAFPSYNYTNARKLIAEHVGTDYEIVEEREVSAGTATTTAQNTTNEATFNSQVPFLPADKQTTTTTTTAKNLTELHIRYRKRMPGTSVSPPVQIQQTGGKVPATVAPAAMTGGLPPPDMTGTGVQR